MIENVMDDLAKINGGKNMNIKLINELIKDLKELNEDKSFDTKQEVLEKFKYTLEDYLIWVEEDLEASDEKPDCDVDKIIEEKRINEF